MQRMKTHTVCPNRDRYRSPELQQQSSPRVGIDNYYSGVVKRPYLSLTIEGLEGDIVAVLLSNYYTFME
jgi:hypothetical protein